MDLVRIERIEAEGFRNLSRLGLDFPSQLTIIHGHNAQGKTNLLEALFLLLRFHSFRTRKTGDLVQFGCVHARVAGDVSTASGERRVSVVLTGRGKVARIDGKRASQVPGFVGETKVVLFVPDDLRLVKGPPALRRRFLDNAIGEIYPRYQDILRSYRKILLQKHRLLSGPGVRPTDLEPWNDRQADLGSRMVVARLRFVRRVRPTFRDTFEEVSRSGTLVDLRYTSPLADDEETPIEVVRERFARMLEERAQEEIRVRRNLVGPQLDGLDLTLEGRPAASFGSQGQQRLVSLSLKFVELQVIVERTRIVPVFLLDDVTSELDRTRNQYLMHRVLEAGCQVFITTTSPDHLAVDPLSDRATVRLVSGEVVQEKAS